MAEMSAMCFCSVNWLNRAPSKPSTIPLMRLAPRDMLRYSNMPSRPGSNPVCATRHMTAAKRASASCAERTGWLSFSLTPRMAVIRCCRAWGWYSRQPGAFWERCEAPRPRRAWARKSYYKSMAMRLWQCSRRLDRAYLMRHGGALRPDPIGSQRKRREPHGEELMVEPQILQRERWDGGLRAVGSCCGCAVRSGERCRGRDERADTGDGLGRILATESEPAAAATYRTALVAFHTATLAGETAEAGLGVGSPAQRTLIARS